MNNDEKRKYMGPSPPNTLYLHGVSFAEDLVSTLSIRIMFDHLLICWGYHDYTSLI